MLLHKTTSAGKEFQSLTLDTKKKKEWFEATVGLVKRLVKRLEICKELIREFVTVPDCCYMPLPLLHRLVQLCTQKYSTSRQRGMHLHPPYPPKSATVQGLSTHTFGPEWHSWVNIADGQLFFSLPYFGFRTSVSAHQPFPLAPSGVYKNTWVTTFLGCLSCINVTKKCYKIYRFSLYSSSRNYFFSYIS